MGEIILITQQRRPKMDGYGTFIIIVGILALARIFTTKEDIRRMEELEARENAMDE